MSHNFFDLSGQVALVTGTSRGLGQYLGRALARAGADLIITSRSVEALEEFQAEIEALGRRAVPVALDVRDEKSITAMADAALQQSPESIRIDSFDPATLEKIGSVEAWSEQRVAQAVDKAREAQAEWERIEVKERGKYLLKVRDYLIEHLDEYAELHND